MTGEPTAVRARWYRRLVLLLVIPALAILAATVVRYGVFHDASQPVAIVDVVSTFRSETGVESPPARRSIGRALPAEGVYVFETSGEESLVDAPLGDARHAYPRETAVVVRRGGCGILEAWLPLEGRGRVISSCEDDRGGKRYAGTDTRTFFGIEARRDITCTGRAVPPLAGARGGSSWRSSCNVTGFSEFAASARSEAMKPQTIVVGGERVRAVGVRTVLRFTGEARGSAVHEMWRRVSDGLPLRELYREQSVLDTHVGDLSYRDRYDLRLTSLEPRR